MFVIRRLILTWLVAAMVLTSGAMALSRSATEGTVIVICTGTDVQTITLDHNGNEIDALPHCPDCLLFKAVLDVPIAVAPAPLRFSIVSSSAKRAAFGIAFDIAADARGPPDFV